MNRLALSLLLCSFFQSAQLGGLVTASDAALAQAAEAARKAGLRDIITYPKQSFTVTWNGKRVGTFLSLGGRSAGSSYQCLHTFISTDRSVAPSVVTTAGAGKLGTDICDRPRAVGILPSPSNQIRIGVLYANSDYLDENKNSGSDAPSVSAALVIDPKTRRMTLDERATETLQKAAPTSLQAMRSLF